VVGEWPQKVQVAIEYDTKNRHSSAPCGVDCAKQTNQGANNVSLELFKCIVMPQPSVRIFFPVCGWTIILSLAASAANACLWDIDTLPMERRLFPGTLEIIAGKFVRHRRAY